MNDHSHNRRLDSAELAELVGRLLVVGFEGTSEAEVEDLVAEIRPAGLILFSRNYPAEGGPERLRELLEAAQAAAVSALGRRLFMAVDHEGGRVQRLPAPYTRLPAAGTLASPEAVAEAAGRGARELAATGFNFNLAPVLDVTGTDTDFLGDRSFGPDPRRAADLGRAFLEAGRRAGILGAGKHFPGLGAAALDPHLELPRIDVPEERLRAADMAPFKTLIDEGLAAVMTTHALYPALDREQPATFSKKIVDLLKVEMGFSGAVLTDDLEMGAVVNTRPPGRAAADAVAAGHDLALVCRKREYIDQSRRALAEAVARGTIPLERLEDARTRTDRLWLRLDERKPAEAELTQWFAELTGRAA